MKKVIILSLCFFFIGVSICFAGAEESVVVATNTSTYVAVTIPNTNRTRKIVYYMDDATAYLIARDASGTGVTTTPASTVLPAVRISSGVLFYVKASAGTPNFVVRFVD